MSKRIAIVDDEPDILELISLTLIKNGYEPFCFPEAKSFFDYYKINTIPDLLVLDLMLPGMDGYEVCRAIRADALFKSLYIIMLSARGDELDKILGLELGADDYVTKPFSPKELISRIKAVFRREQTDMIQPDNCLWIKNLVEINAEKFEARLSGVRLDLTTTEFKILELLASHKGRLYTRQQILYYLWGNEKGVHGRTVDVHVKNLRDKLGIAAEYIVNIRGMGYKLAE